MRTAAGRLQAGQTEAESRHAAACASPSFSRWAHAAGPCRAGRGSSALGPSKSWSGGVGGEGDSQKERGADRDQRSQPAADCSSSLQLESSCSFLLTTQHPTHLITPTQTAQTNDMDVCILDPLTVQVRSHRLARPVAHPGPRALAGRWGVHACACSCAWGRSAPLRTGAASGDMQTRGPETSELVGCKFSRPLRSLFCVLLVWEIVWCGAQWHCLHRHLPPSSPALPAPCHASPSPLVSVPRPSLGDV